MTMMDKWQALLMMIYLKMNTIIGKLMYSITWRLMRYIEIKIMWPAISVYSEINNYLYYKCHYSETKTAPNILIRIARTSG